MRVVKVTLEGYRSLRDVVELHLDPLVTIVLGANDHGKTNILDGLLHLNSERRFDDDDLNWDRVDSRASLPRIRYELRLSDMERAELREIERLERARKVLGAELETVDADRSGAESIVQPLREAVEIAKARVAELQQAAAQLQGQEISDDNGQESVAPELDALGAAQQELAAAEADLQPAETELTAADRRLLVAQGRTLEIDHALAGGEAGDALGQAIAAAEEQLVVARNVETTADDKQREAAVALETATAELPAASEELATAQKAASSADAAAKRTARDAERKQRAVERLTATAEALAAWRADSEGWGHSAPDPPAVPDQDVPYIVMFERSGVGEPLMLVECDFAKEVTDRFARARLPAVRKISPTSTIPDRVSRKSLDQDASVFMRGIFHYAALAPHEWDQIFTQTDITQRRLDDASRALNETLSNSWRQGRKLEFLLKHDSATKRIDLLIKDPAVQKQFVRASRRSSGFTHFFALKTTLHALQQESTASSYLWVFDEPGVYLHPDGQHDLVQVMETLAQANQVVYSTHSVFMANKNFPARHRLVIKTNSGTKIDSKPFRSRWRPAINALGMSMPGTLLFASRVLLVEGDSDAILFNAMLQKLLEIGVYAHDLNSLSIMAAGDAADAAALVRLLTESAIGPQIAAVFDGDDGGTSRKRALERVVDQIDRLNRNDVPIKLLSPKNLTSEDIMPAAGDLYPRALAVYLSKMSPRRGDDDMPLREEVFWGEIDACRSDLAISSAQTHGLADWIRKIGKSVGHLDGPPSKVGVGREYAALLQVADRELMSANTLKRGREFAKWIAQSLDLPELTLREGAILVEDPVDEDEMA
jgi:predicted ATP-dependent endonuclease of OLD family